MRYIEASPRLRLRPSHLLLMIYRYMSGIYQVGDLSALNYIKGFLDGISTQPKPERVLTVSGHGIGEAEMWLAERVDGCKIDTISFRLVDTQLLQFLRAAEATDIETVFSKFSQMVAPYEVLSELVSDPGLVPYWCEQMEAITRCFQEGRVTVFSDHPLRIPSSRFYDLIYVSHGWRYFSMKAAEELRRHLSPQGWLAILMPSQDDSVDGKISAHGRFTNSPLVREARTLFKKLLEDRGYVLKPYRMPQFDLRALAARRELIRFSVLAPASSILIGELILRSLGEHISDRARLEVLNETAARFKTLRAPVNEELELYIMEAKP
jgi:SAM-dependent methyltransferase